MTSQTRKNRFLILLFNILIITISVNLTNAQQEIPDNIKDLILKGINALDSSKVPEDIDDALGYFKEANKLAQNFPDVHYYLGKTLAMLQGNGRNAVKELRKYIELYPDAPDKENVENDISRLEDALKSERKSALMDVDLIELSDGIYVKSLNTKAIHRLGSRFQVLQVGDKILKINGEDITGLTLQEALNKIDSESSDEINLTISRGADPVNVSVSKALNNKVAQFNIKQLGENDLIQIIKESKTPIIILWNTKDCGECFKYYITFMQLMGKYNEAIDDIEVKMDENKMVGDEFNIAIEELPVVSIYNSGSLVKIIKGYDPDLLKETVKGLIED